MYFDAPAPAGFPQIRSGYNGPIMTRTDVAVIGAGPIGLELAIALKRAGVDYVQFEAAQIGQTIYAFPPQMRFFSSPGRIGIGGVPLQTLDQSKATREEYLTYLRAVALQFGLAVRTYEPVVGIERDGGGFELRTLPAGRLEQTCRARRIVIATGGTGRPRRLDIPGEALPHVSHDLGDPHRYFRRRVLVVGGKNSAVEAALRCHHVGADVAISYRRAAFDARAVKYWLLPEINMLIETRRIAGHLQTVPTGISTTHVTLHPAGGNGAERGEATHVPADFVLLMIGFEADMTVCRLAGVELTGPAQAPVFDELTMQTNVPGVYVAGTAAAGTQDKYSVFLENCHVHVERIVAALTGAAPPPAPAPIARPET